MNKTEHNNKPETITDSELMLALFGEEVDSCLLDEVKRFAEFVKQRGVLQKEEIELPEPTNKSIVKFWTFS